MSQTYVDPYEQDILDNIEARGWHLALIEEEGYLPRFGYTIGLNKNYEHPEIICFGLKSELLAGLLSAVANDIKNGKKFEPNVPYENYLDDYAVQFVEVLPSHATDYLGYCAWYNKDESYKFPVLQLVWPDKAGRYPWSNEYYEAWRFKQKLLDRDQDYKFYESKKLGVFTTSPIANDNHPILMVSHDRDGDWQFLCGTTNNSEDAVFTEIGKMAELDNSVNELFDMPEGWYAWRKSPEHPWIRARQ